MTQQFLVLTVKGYEKFEKNRIVVSDSAPQKWVNFLRAGEKIETLNFMGWFCLKDKLLEEKFTQQFPVLTVKGCGKFQQNLNCGF